MSDSEAWYIIKHQNGHCEIISLPSPGDASYDGLENQVHEQWGPFASRDEAIARRIGLIRAGKCQPN
jgi:hypothetical protein